MLDRKFAALSTCCFWFLISCSGESGLGPIFRRPSPEVLDFVGSQHLPQLRSVTRLFHWDGIEVFQIEYGPPQDCPSGCFYFGGFGVRSGSKIGWMRLEGVNDVDPDSSFFFDVTAADSVLCRADVWDRMQSASDNWFFWNALLPRLARDADSGPEALRRISRMVYDQIVPLVAAQLVANPWVQTDVASLCNLTKLSVLNDVTYHWIAQRAQQLLDDLNVDCIAPEP
jgi:hypothetical protein